MEYLYTYLILLALNAMSIISMSAYLMYFLIPKTYKENRSQYEALKQYISELKPLQKADIYSRYLIPFYGMSMSFYCLYLLIFDEDLKQYSMSMKFKLVDKELNKFRIFKRNYKWKNYYYC